MGYETILAETHAAVGLIRLNRPEALNALSTQLVSEMVDALETFGADPAIGAIVIIGNDKAFAAGADIREMQDKTYIESYLADFPNGRGGLWQRFTACRKPIIAAVAGYAYGAGCELAMMCDFILAADNAKFAQPEIKLATIPGAGGTQRLARLVGKSKAMEMVLTGRTMDAVEAERCGLVSRVLPLAELLDEAMKTAARIAALSMPSVIMAKESVNRAFETSLAEGLVFERRLFLGTFATDDRKEGMAAFAEKRSPQFKHR